MRAIPRPGSLDPRVCAIYTCQDIGDISSCPQWAEGGEPRRNFATHLSRIVNANTLLFTTVQNVTAILPCALCLLKCDVVWSVGESKHVLLDRPRTAAGRSLPHEARPASCRWGGILPWAVRQAGCLRIGPFLTGLEYAENPFAH